MLKNMKLLLLLCLFSYGPPKQNLTINAGRRASTEGVYMGRRLSADGRVSLLGGSVSRRGSTTDFVTPIAVAPPLPSFTATPVTAAPLPGFASGDRELSSRDMHEFSVSRGEIEMYKPSLTSLEKFAEFIYHPSLQKLISFGDFKEVVKSGRVFQRLVSLFLFKVASEKSYDGVASFADGVKAKFTEFGIDINKFYLGSPFWNTMLLLFSKALDGRMNLGNYIRHLEGAITDETNEKSAASTSINYTAVLSVAELLEKITPEQFQQYEKEEVFRSRVRNVSLGLEFDNSKFNAYLSEFELPGLKEYKNFPKLELIPIIALKVARDQNIRSEQDMILPLLVKILDLGFDFSCIIPDSLEFNAECAGRNSVEECKKQVSSGRSIDLQDVLNLTEAFEEQRAEMEAQEQEFKITEEEKANLHFAKAVCYWYYSIFANSLAPNAKAFSSNAANVFKKEIIFLYKEIWFQGHVLASLASKETQDGLRNLEETQNLITGVLAQLDRRQSFGVMRPTNNSTTESGVFSAIPVVHENNSPVVGRGVSPHQDVGDLAKTVNDLKELLQQQKEPKKAKSGCCVVS